MTNIAQKEAQTNSLTPGLQDLGAVTGTVTLASQTIGVGGSVTTSIPLTFPKITDTLSLIRINVTGGNMGNYWFPMTPSLMLKDSNTGSYTMWFMPVGSSTGRKINIEVTNQASAASVTIPTLTFTAYAHLYSFPWS